MQLLWCVPAQNLWRTLIEVCASGTEDWEIDVDDVPTAMRRPDLYKKGVAAHPQLLSRHTIDFFLEKESHYRFNMYICKIELNKI